MRGEQRLFTDGPSPVSGEGEGSMHRSTKKYDFIHFKRGGKSKCMGNGIDHGRRRSLGLKNDPPK